MKVFNIIGFQTIWWTTIFYQNGVLPLAALFIAVHICLQKKEERLTEVYFITAVASIGLLVDSILLNMGLMGFAGQSEVGLVRLPLWMLAIWLGFSVTLRHSLAWLFSKKWLLYIVGSVGAAGSYIAAAKLGALEFKVTDTQAWIAMILIWAVLFFIFERFFRMSEPKTVSN